MILKKYNKINYLKCFINISGKSMNVISLFGHRFDDLDEILKYYR